ncbi:hemerythrin domain-containing protein [Streptomyces sp. NPDC007189]|uniref:hemerythrin domain-containing protein n=1 Tax=Streptomyces sp. NPDC007189 TaxID=3154315 RepID=UPI003452C5BF
MSKVHTGLEEATDRADDDVVSVLVAQHGMIKDLLAEVKSRDGEVKQRAFDVLRELLAVHEAAEEVIVRPAVRDTAGKAQTDARNQEEAEAARVLEELEKRDVDLPEFDLLFVKLERMVLEHAEREEQEEFPALRAGHTEDELRTMAHRLREVEETAPTHPHPMAAGSPKLQRLTGPFASMLDRARDRLGGT